MARINVLAPIALVVLIASSVSACAAGGNRPPGDARGNGGFAQGNAQARMGAGDSFSQAARLVDAGRHDLALPILRCIADQGQGYEVAQYLAGHSALQMSELETTPDILRAELRVEGFDRLILAANAGWPSAQAELARWFADTPGVIAREQAAYWAAVYRGNRRDRAYGLDRLDNALEDRIREAAGAESAAAAEADASAFTIATMPRAETRTECARFTRQAGGRGQMRPGRSDQGGARGSGRRPGGSVQPIQ